MISDVDPVLEKEARRILEEALGRRVSEGAWAWMIRAGCLEIHAFPRDEWKPMLLSYWGEYQQAEQRERPAEGRDRPEYSHVLDGPWRLSRAEEVRAAAVSEAVAQIATALPSVVDYRAAVLRNKRMSEGEARDPARVLNEDAYARLQELAGDLVHQFGWELREAKMFVLSGAIPQMHPIAAVVERWDCPDEYAAGKLRTRSKITLQVEPWVSERTVRQAYRGLQAITIGRRKNRVHRRELAVFRFALRFLGYDGQPQTSWAQVARDWNQDKVTVHEDWGYADIYDLKPAYERTRNRLLNEDVHVEVGPEESPRPPNSVSRRAIRFRGKLKEITEDYIWPNSSDAQRGDGAGSGDNNGG